VKRNKHKKHIIAIEIVAILILVSGSFLILNPSLTGYVSAAAYTQPLNLVVEESSDYTIASDKPLSLMSFSISGSVTGKGAAEIYLVTRQGDYLIYSNWAPMRSNQITSMIESELEIVNVRQNSNIPNVWENTIVKEESFSKVCLETCTLPFIESERFELRILLDEKTTLRLDQITYTSNN
jgi:hypothetical protein